MVQGTILNDRLFLYLNIYGNLPSSVQTIFVQVDTGFTDELKISSDYASLLELTVDGKKPFEIYNSQVTELCISKLHAEIENETKPVEACIDDGILLIGIKFLKKFGYKTIKLDFHNHTFTLDKNI